MIRLMKESDINRVMDIWLDTNLSAHDFIPAEYWQANFEAVTKMLPQAKVYVYENDDNTEIDGFIGITENYIAGIFVCAGMQSSGIGKQLLDYAKSQKDSLFLNVYQKNRRAVQFYLREQFEIQEEGTDGSTGETEFLMEWKIIK